MKKLSILTILLFFSQHQSQVGINTQTPAATLDVVSKNTDGSKAEGLILPRLSGEALYNAQLQNVYGLAQHGVLLFVTSAPSYIHQTGATSEVTLPGIYFYDANTNKWLKMGTLSSPATLSDLLCTSSSNSGSLFAKTEAIGVSTTIPYSGGNGGAYPSQNFPSTGVTGLEAHMQTGNLANGNGTLLYTISGIPENEGLATFNINFGDYSCIISHQVNPEPFAIQSLNCNTSTYTGTIMPQITYTVADEITISVPYTGGNSSSYQGQNIFSKGITGLTAILEGGNFANGNGVLLYRISGTAPESGAAAFDLSIGGQQCTLVVGVGCGAFLAPGIWKVFMCHNLGALVNSDPFTPASSIQGSKYQWGRKIEALNQNEDQISSDPGVAGWNTTSAPGGSWRDTMKTGNDPCPSGFRIPTSQQFQNIALYNRRIILGAWVPANSNYTSAVRWANVMLPAGGYRNATNGILQDRGLSGFYWNSSSPSNHMNFGREFQDISYAQVTTGMSVRCVAE